MALQHVCDYCLAVLYTGENKYKAHKYEVFLTEGLDGEGYAKEKKYEFCDYMCMSEWLVVRHEIDQDSKKKGWFR